MLYSVQFVAISVHALAARITKNPDAVVRQAEKWIRRNCVAEEKQIPIIVDACSRLCRRDVPTEAEQCDFDAGFALLMSAGSPIQLKGFTDFHSISYLEQIGIWPWMQIDRMPYHPISQLECPSFGFISAARMRNEASQLASSLPSTDDYQVRLARNQFFEVVASTESNEEDLAAYLSVW